jgi:HSP20 family protein
MGTGPTCAFRSRAEMEYRHRRHIQVIKDGKPCRGNTPRQWLYATKPAFARVEQPLAAALEEVEEVRLMMDLRPFWPADVRIEVKLDAYVITATRGELQFVEEIPLPDNVDMLMKEARFKNGVLELILPRKAVPSHTCRLEKGN